MSRGGKRTGAGRPIGTKKEPTVAYQRKIMPEWIPILDKVLFALKRTKKRALCSIEETQSLIKQYEDVKKDCILPSESKAWLELGKKINARR